MRQVNVVLCDQFKELSQLVMVAGSDRDRQTLNRCQCWQRRGRGYHTVGTAPHKRTGDCHTVGTAPHKRTGDRHTVGTAPHKRTGDRHTVGTVSPVSDPRTRCSPLGIDNICFFSTYFAFLFCSTFSPILLFSLPILLASRLFSLSH